MSEAANLTGIKLHPLSLAINFVAGLPQLIIPIVALSFGARNASENGIFLIVAPIILLVTLAVQAIIWMRFRYYIGEDDIRIESGLFNRTARSIPYDRIQDVSIEEKLLPRIFDLAEVKFDTGGGGGKAGDEAKLSYVLASDAVALRETIRSRKMGISALESSNPINALQETESETLFSMDNRRVLTLGFYSFSLVILAVLAGLAQQFDFLLPFDLWDFKAWIGAASDRGVSIDAISANARIFGAIVATLGLLALGVATGIITTFLREYGYQLDLTPKGFRRRRGLLSKTDVVIPMGRVQAAVISTGPIRKLRGWHALHFVSMAKDGANGTDHVAAPFAKLHEIAPIIAITNIDPISQDVVFEKSPIGPWIDRWVILSLLILIIFAATYFIADITAYWILPLIALLAPIYYFRWRREMHAVNDTQIYSKHGWWREKTTIALQTHVQSVSIFQGPINRMRGLARIHFGIAGGYLIIRTIPVEKAKLIQEQVLNIAAPIDFSALDNLIDHRIIE
jgi:putative membrane protein